MYTRCPQCATVHPLSAALLSHAGGAVRCGQCGSTFNALSFLFDEWPAGQSHGSAVGLNTAPPILGSGKKGPEESDSDIASNSETANVANTRTKLVWMTATVVLVMLTIANTIWTFREPLMKYPLVTTWLNKSDWQHTDQKGLLKDPQQIRLVSQDMHAHPTRSGILILNLTFVNLAQRNQVFPELQLTLLDETNQTVARRLLQPVNYLRPGTLIDAGLGTGVYLPVLLELGDPGEHTVGFEIQFL